VKTKNKNYKINQSQQKNSYKRPLLVTTMVCIVAILATGYFIYDKDKTNEAMDSNAKTTSTAETAQSDFSGGNDRPIQEADNEKGEAIISDNSGSISEIPNESNWTTSSSGEITLYAPSQNQLIENGYTISGKSTLPVISFRIIDDISGVISTGELSVVDGKYSGSISLSTSASGGRLDIFGTKEDGSEYSNIEVLVRFK